MALSIEPSGHFIGNDGPWSTFNVWIGPSLGPFQVLPASSLSITLVVVGEGCPQDPPAPADCSKLRGNIFDTRNSSTWKGVTPADGLEYAIVNLPTEGDFLPEPIPTEPGVDLLKLDWKGDILPENQLPLGGQFIAGYAAKVPFLGLIGLSGFQSYPVSGNVSYNSTLQALGNRSTISTLTWAYTAGASYKKPQSYGSLTFGGYDSSLVNMNEALTGMNFTRGPGGNGDELTLKIKTITVGETAEPSELVALLDSMLPDIWLPQSICDVFEDKFNLRWNDTSQMYLISPDQRNQLLNEDTSVSFDLTSGSNPDKVTKITLPYAAFDREVNYPILDITNETMHYFPLRPMVNRTKFDAVLGRTFFQEAYVSADYERKTFNVGQALFPTDLPSTIVTIYPVSAPGPSKALGAGAIAGIAVGAFLLLSAIAALTWWMRRRRRRERLAKQETRTARAISVDEITLAALDPESAIRNEYYKPTQELASESRKDIVSPGFVKYELDANATATGPTGQVLERHELAAGSVHYRPGHRQNLSFGSSVSGISPMGVGDRISDVFGEPSPPMALSSGSPSPPLSDRRMERPGTFPPFEMA